VEKTFEQYRSNTKRRTREPKPAGGRAAQSYAKRGEGVKTLRIELERKNREKKEKGRVADAVRLQKRQKNVEREEGERGVKDVQPWTTKAFTRGLVAETRFQDLLNSVESGRGRVLKGKKGA